MNPEKPQPLHASLSALGRPAAGRGEGEAVDPPRPGYPSRSPEPRTDGASLASRLWTIAEGKWTIATIAGAFVAAGAMYLLAATPIYRSAVTLQVEDRTRTLAGLEELSNVFAERVPAEAEMEILLSRNLLGAVVDELGLSRRAEPRRFPILGRLWATRATVGQPAPPRLWLPHFAWGGEVIKVDRLDVSEDLLDERLVLTAGEAGHYSVEDPGGGPPIQGEVGKPAASQAGAPRIELFVTELVARPGTQFRLTGLRRDDVVADLQKGLRVAEKGKKTGIMTMTLDGPDPARVAAILRAVSGAYLRQNVERKSAEAAKTLEFIESQLPSVKSNLDAAQSALNTFQVRKGVVNLTGETTSILNRSVEVEKAIQDLEMQRAELRQRFTGNHPALASLNEKAQQLRTERAVLAARMRDVPAAEVDSARLLRDVKSSTELYTLLLNKAQELRVVKSGTIGNVRVLDEPLVPHRPEQPRPGLVMVLALAIGLMAGVAGVFVREAFHQGAEDADEIEAETGLAVYASIPHSNLQTADVGAAPLGQARAVSLLAATAPGDVAVENLRSLRTSLQFALVESRNNVVAIGGPGPGVGKSFVCANLAWVLASPERRVLLVDCDLRRGGLHRFFGESRHPGVSDVVSGGFTPQEAIRTTSNPNLDILPTGRIPPNPAELLGSRAFEHLLEWASPRYGLVLCDTPPILAVTDPALVARLAGVNLLVLRAGQHPVHEISLALKRLAQSGVKVQGAVLNDVKVVRGRYGKYGRYQRYEYHSDSGATKEA